jgi:hypothetical protein
MPGGVVNAERAPDFARIVAAAAGPYRRTALWVSDGPVQNFDWPKC